MVGGGEHCNIMQAFSDSPASTWEWGGGGLQRHESSQSRGGEDRLHVGLTGTVCFERNLMLQSSRKKNQMAVATTGRTNGAT